MHTPRLCIDARAALDFQAQGAIAQEVVDQLVAGLGEGEASSAWIEKKRTVLLTHPTQLFAGQLKRFDTKRRIGRTPISWTWEKNFIEKANISAFHRFRPADRLRPGLPCPLIDTVLPPVGKLPKRIRCFSNSHYFVVPSVGDKKMMVAHYELPEDQVLVFRPTVRRFVHFKSEFKSSGEGMFLLLTDGTHSLDVKKLIRVLDNQYPTLQKRLVSTRGQFSPQEWMKVLENTRLCFYLSTSPFDWVSMALECLYFDVPLITMDANRTLSELMLNEKLSFSRFLIDNPSLQEIQKETSLVRQRLHEKGIFHAFGQATQYRTLYEKFQSTQGLDLVATPEEPECEKLRQSPETNSESFFV